VARYVPPFAGNSWWQFSIKSLLLLTTVVSVLLALLNADPEWGALAITLAVLGIPALMLTCSLNNRYVHASKVLPLDIRLPHFMVSAGIYVMIGVYGVSVGAFLVFFASFFLSLCAAAVKTPSLVIDVLQTSSFALPIIVSLGLMWFLLRESWPKEYLVPTPLVPESSPR
jgi:hypothetical protein